MFINAVNVTDVTYPPRAHGYHVFIYVPFKINFLNNQKNNNRTFEITTHKTE